MDLGTSSSAFSAVTTYTSGSLSHTLTDLGDGLVTGLTYSFRFKATNAIGDSEYSTVITVSANDPPGTPTAITQDMTLSTETSINVYWDSIADGAAPGGTITGYILTVE